jgi:hypothetical protein
MDFYESNIQIMFLMQLIHLKGYLDFFNTVDNIILHLSDSGDGQLS